MPKILVDNSLRCLALRIFIDNMFDDLVNPKAVSLYRNILFNASEIWSGNPFCDFRSERHAGPNLLSLDGFGLPIRF